MINTELGHRFITGGEIELEEIVANYGEKLLRYATAILCDYQEAEDVTQEVFISAYNNRNSFDGGNLSAWLYKITYNRCLNQLKKRKIFNFNRIQVDLSSLKDDISVEVDIGIDIDMSDNTLCALRRLKPKERALLYGRIIHEQSYEELSILSGCSTTALRKQYERAKKKLVGYLTSVFNEEDEKNRREHKYEQV